MQIRISENLFASLLKSRMLTPVKREVGLPISRRRVPPVESAAPILEFPLEISYSD